MKQPANPDVTKLPQWAQRRIDVLERNVANLESELLAMQTPGASNVHMTRGIKDDVPLPPNSHIEFTLANGCRIGVYIREEGLDINAHDGVLILLPRAANSAYAASKKGWTA